MIKGTPQEDQEALHKFTVKLLVDEQISSCALRLLFHAKVAGAHGYQKMSMDIINAAQTIQNLMETWETKSDENTPGG